MPEDKLEFQAIMDYVHWYSAGPQRLDVVREKQAELGQYINYIRRYRQLENWSATNITPMENTFKRITPHQS